jgi:hypothetical protein
MDRTKKIVAAVGLVALGERLDRLAESYEAEGNTTRSEACDLMAFRVRKALEDEPGLESVLTEGDLSKVLEDLKDLNDEEAEILDEALFGEEPPLDMEEEETVPFGGEETPEEEAAEEDVKKKEAEARLAALRAKKPVKRAYRVTAVK